MVFKVIHCKDKAKVKTKGRSTNYFKYFIILNTIKRRCNIRNFRSPRNCHLWQKEIVEKDDLDFEVIDRIIKSSHFDRFIVKCRRCGQLYLYEFVEIGKWTGGDIIYTAFIPVDEEDIEELKNKTSSELFAIKPRLQWEHDNIYWVGK